VSDPDLIWDKPALRLGAYQLRQALKRKVLARSGLPAWLLRGSWPRRLLRRAESISVSRDAGLGDVLMTTPLLRYVKQLAPDCRTRLYTTTFAPLVRGLSYIDEVLPYELRPPEAHYLTYEEAIPTKCHLAQIFADHFGLRLPDTVPDCVVRLDLVEAYRAAWASWPRPHILVLRRASGWTPNKDWPNTYWDILLGNLTKTCTIIEIGVDPQQSAPQSFEKGYIDLRGRTDAEHLAAAVAAADLYLGPVSGPLHIAAATNTPALLIGGGYEHPSVTRYPTSTMLYTDVACAPCWLNTPCPHNRVCLTSISPAAVEQAIWRTLEEFAGKPRVLRYPSYPVS
jgi:ADP-heptose:LPS heptosyltransferase